MEVLLPVLLDEFRNSLPAYAHPSSPKKFTLPQLGCLVVGRRMTGVSYRELCKFLKQDVRIRTRLGLRAVPHHTTLFQFEKGYAAQCPYLTNCLAAITVQSGSLREGELSAQLSDNA